VTSHDGFTLADLVSYDVKHNAANGEANRDGQDDNLSWNCGEEGHPASEETEALRARQVRNFAALLLLSQGVPMILAGDELGRTQLGNNNAYCQDNEISWFDWSLLERNHSLFRFFCRLIRFRKLHPNLRRRRFCVDGAPPMTTVEGAPPMTTVEGAGVPGALVWHGVERNRPDWSWESRSLALQLLGAGEDDELYLAANAHWEGHLFELPRLSGERRWRLFLDTSKPPPHEIEEPGGEAPLSGSAYPVGPRSVVVLVGR
jgi:glycogen operon protein